jgi:hypothetical protein
MRVWLAAAAVLAWAGCGVKAPPRPPLRESPAPSSGAPSAVPGSPSGPPAAAPDGGASDARDGGAP